MKTGGDAAAYDLGIEGGGTKTVALTNHGQRHLFGPLNLQLATDRHILAVLRRFRPRRAALCLAGCRTPTDAQRLRQLARRAWGDIPLFVGNDLDSGLAAALGEQPGILVLSGTGSVVVGRNGAGQTARAGGWGHILGDHGSGYWIALTGLRNALREHDRRGRPLAAILRRLCLNHPEDLVAWAHRSTKDEIAALADEFLDRDPGLILQAASFLAQDAHAVAGKLGLTTPRVALAGGVLTHHRKLATLLGNRIRTMLPGATVRVFRGDTATGALRLAQQQPRPTPMPRRPLRPAPVTLPSTPLPLTEQRNRRTLTLHRQSVPQLVDTLLAEEARVLPAIRRARPAIVRCIRRLVAALRRGGRVFYVGAGTSGRLGVLDASECPPTFSTDPDMIQAIIAGGVRALSSAVEAAEDDPVAGAEAIRHRAVTGRDVVIGITASGRTPFVLGALDEARRRGAKTVLLTATPVRTPHMALTVVTGPEAITGSTRLKAGTATKIVLNLLSTCAMIRLGKVVSNLMVDVKPTNEKLRARACRIVAALRGVAEAQARQRLQKTGWNVARALRYWPKRRP